MKSKQQKKQKQYIIAVIVTVLLVGGWFLFSSRGESTPTVSDNISEVFSDDVVKGNPQAKAILIEYADFQCGACKSMHERYKLIWRVVQDDLLVVYRHYPLSHYTHSRMASRYSEAMHLQNKFWPFHDLVYDHQSEWSDLSSSAAEAMFQNFVMQAGGDLEQVKKDLQDSAIDRKIDRDMEMGNRSDLTGTPTLILNGRKIDIPVDLSKFVSEIKALNRP